MALTVGTRLGVYEVTAQIGEGGMGQVYRGRDTTLNRDVALKVLPDAFASDPDRLARFTREAQTLASLNHPNIAHIHGLEESGGVRTLAMELVQGEDLSQRIMRGAIPLDEALPIAKQIVEALEAALEGDEASGWKPETPTVFLGTTANEQKPRFSPDGKWLAYESNESFNRFEIYVQPYPGPGAITQISTGGGTNPVWSRTPGRNELLYVAPDGRIMVVSYTATGDAFHSDKPHVWSETPIQSRPFGGASFDIHPDGQRVAMAPVADATAGPTHVTFIFNFFDELRRLAPVTKR